MDSPFDNTEVFLLKYPYTVFFCEVKIVFSVITDCYSSHSLLQYGEGVNTYIQTVSNWYYVQNIPVGTV